MKSTGSSCRVLNARDSAPSPEADRRTLIRRLHFDLTGLPPSPEAVDAFLADARADAYRQAVDRLLDSEHFGERMAVHWLDLVRYADSSGYHGDQEIHVSPYRDYVINAFNSNLPFDQFTIEQLAGDLLPEPTVWQKVATGYNRLNMTTEEEGVQPGEYLAKYAADRVRTTASVWLGATLGCAECHDHKFDPYTQEDFYRFAAFFADLGDKGSYAGLRERPPVMRVATPEEEEAIAKLDAAIADAKQEFNRGVVNESTYDELKLILRLKPEKRSAAEQKLVDQFNGSLPPELAARRERLQKLNDDKTRMLRAIPVTLVAASSHPREVRVLRRGDWMDTRGEVVQPGLPSFLSAPVKSSDRLTRLDLARWLVSREHPLTARVFVNRLWKLFWGAGISKTLDDLGAQGERPTHPELLDWLALDFMENGWNIKRTIRLLVMSSTYRQSSIAPPAPLERDPHNRLCARQSRWRLEAEFIRDGALAISGLLSKTIGGPSVSPYQPEGYYRHMNYPGATYQSNQDENQYRRGLYTHWRRTFLHPSLLAFDAPSREECVAMRNISNTPAAALTLLNDPSFVECARVFAQRAMEQRDMSDSQRIDWAFDRALGRRPDAREQAVLVNLLKRHRQALSDAPEAALKTLQIGLAPSPSSSDANEVAAWTSVTRTMLNLNETITRN